MIRLEDRKFLMFSTADNRTELQLLSTRVEEAVEKHNTEHPEEKVRMAVRCRMRMEEEDPYTFLREVVEEKDLENEKLIEEILRLKNDREALEKMSRKSAECGPREATKKICDTILEDYMNGRSD